MTTVTTAMESGELRWRSAAMPNLSYRSTTSTPYTDSSHSIESGMTPHKLTTSGPTIREIRDSLPQSPSVQTRSPLVHSKVPKKKPSLFGGLFAKEPSMVALEQFSANMAAQRGGSVTVKTVPHVSSQKMPAHVPKVNTKWDGVPDAVKEMDKSRQRANRASLLVPAKHGLRIMGVSDSNRYWDRRNSIAGSWDSRSSGSRPEFEDHGYRRPDSMYSISSCTSNQRRSRAPVQSNSLRSPSTSSLPEITSFFPDNTASISQTPGDCIGSDRSITTSVFSNTNSNEMRSTVPSEVATSIPGHSSSSITYPSRRSPQVPGQDSEESWHNRNTSKSFAHSDVVSRKIQPVDAFLAGEASPLELPNDDGTAKHFDSLPHSQVARSGPPSAARLLQGLETRPDSSRARLGLRASMIVQTGSAPWERDDGKQQFNAPTPTSPRNKLRVFGR